MVGHDDACGCHAGPPIGVTLDYAPDVDLSTVDVDALAKSIMSRLRSHGVGAAHPTAPAGQMPDLSPTAGSPFLALQQRLDQIQAAAETQGRLMTLDIERWMEGRSA